MSTEIPTKTCKMCCMEIPTQARKCPHCQHFQSRLWMVMFHPAVACLFAVVPLLVAVAFMASIFDEGEDFQYYQSQIQITDSGVDFGETKAGATVAVMGTITNTSSIPWKDIQFHVDFFKSDGKRADVGQKEEYAFYLPAKDSISFKVSFRREFPEAHYVKHSVRVLTAKDARAKW